MTASSGIAGEKPRVLVLGLGNDILTDDAIGLKIVSTLQEQFASRSGIEFGQTTEMGLALLDFIVGFDRVVIIDSIQTGTAAPGTIHELDAAGLKQLAGATPHFLGVAETLALGRKLGMRMPEEVRIFAIEVKDPYTLGTNLSRELAATLPANVEHIRAYLAEQCGLEP